MHVLNHCDDGDDVVSLAQSASGTTFVHFCCSGATFGHLANSKAIVNSLALPTTSSQENIDAFSSPGVACTLQRLAKVYQHVHL